MNSRFNSRLQNRDEPKQGNVASYFDNLKNLVQVNDGTRSFVLKTVDCHDHSAPFDESQETRIAITHSDHHISQITDGFLTIRLQPTLQLLGIDQANFDDPYHLCKIVCASKSTNTLLWQNQILNRNLDVGYQQNECIREGFAYSVIKPKQEKKTKKYIHTLYENVANYSPSIAGKYLNVVDLKDGLSHTTEFEVNLPFEDILALQAFDLYPNAVCGDLELKFYLRHIGLVWCMIDPAVVKNYKEYIEGQSIDLTFANNPSVMFRHAFTQIGNSAEIINKVTIDGNEATFSKGEVRLVCTGMKILSIKSNMYGFKVAPSTLAHIENIFSTPQIIPSQQLDYNAFPIAATAAGIQSTINMPVTNCSCISIVFPKNDNDITVFENPIYSNLQLTVNGKNMPDEVVDSQGARFLQQQLVASDLSGGLECTKEFEDSMVMAKNTPEGTRYANCLSDGTSFIWNVQAERNNAGYTFDGIDSNGQNIPIQIRGQPIYTGVNDTYYNFKGDNSAHPPPPQIWLCRDTYFLVSTQGVRYVNNDTPEGKQVYE